MTDRLARYRRQRDVARTPEPDGAIERRAALAAELARPRPAAYTASFSKRARRSRVFIDCLRHRRRAGRRSTVTSDPTPSRWRPRWRQCRGPRLAPDRAGGAIWRAMRDPCPLPVAVAGAPSEPDRAAGPAWRCRFAPRDREDAVI